MSIIPHNQQETGQATVISTHPTTDTQKIEIGAVIGDFIGIPYKPQGDTFDGVDCLGLMVLYYRTLGKDVTIPAYEYHGEISVGKMKEYDREVKRWAANKKIIFIKEDLQPNDLICFSQGGKFITHLGAYIGYGKFLHIVAGAGKSALESWHMNNTNKFKFGVRF